MKKYYYVHLPREFGLTISRKPTRANIEVFASRHGYMDRVDDILIDETINPDLGNGIHKYLEDAWNAMMNK